MSRIRDIASILTSANALSTDTGVSGYYAGGGGGGDGGGGGFGGRGGSGIVIVRYAI